MTVSMVLASRATVVTVVLRLTATAWAASQVLVSALSVVPQLRLIPNTNVNAALTLPAVLVHKAVRRAMVVLCAPPV